MTRPFRSLFSAFCFFLVCQTARAQTNFPVSIRLDAANPLGELKPIWHMFGADEPNYASMKNGKKLLSELGALAPRNVYCRAHNLLCSGDGTAAFKWRATGAYYQDAQAKATHNWTILSA